MYHFKLIYMSTNNLHISLIIIIIIIIIVIIIIIIVVVVFVIIVIIIIVIIIHYCLMSRKSMTWEISLTLHIYSAKHTYQHLRLLWTHNGLSS